MIQEQKENWDKFWDKPVSSQATPSWSKVRILKVLKSYIKPGARVLDAGCGSGFFSKFFCENGMLTTSVDYSDNAINLTNSATCGRAETLRLDLKQNYFNKHFKERFDLIFSDGLFEHFTHAEQDLILTNLKDVLAPDGYIISFVPNLFSPWTLIRPLFMPGIEEKPFTIKELKDLHDRNKLEIVKWGGINTFPWRISIEGEIAIFAGMLLYAVSRTKTFSNS